MPNPANRAHLPPGERARPGLDPGSTRAARRMRTGTRGDAGLRPALTGRGPPLNKCAAPPGDRRRRAPTASQTTQPPFLWKLQIAKVAEPADKPGSVVDSHSSRRTVTGTLEQPTRTRRGQRHEVPIWSCSRWGLPCRPVTRLAVRSYRTISPLPRASCDAVRRYLSVALSVGSRRPGVTWHRALWSPDFPRHPCG